MGETRKKLSPKHGYSYYLHKNEQQTNCNYKELNQLQIDITQTILY